MPKLNLKKECKQSAITFTYNAPIKFTEELGDGNTNPLEFLIDGVAINSTTTSNNHKFLPEVLESSAHTLVGVPLLKDHINSVDSIVGRVKKAEFQILDQNIIFQARIHDRKMQEMIRDGRLNSVSIGADIPNPEDIIEDEDGALVPQNLIFRELSLVAVPADAGATFGFEQAMHEAYNSYKATKPSDSHSENIELKGGSKQVMENETNEFVSKEDFVSMKDDMTAKVDAQSKLIADVLEKVGEISIQMADADEEEAKEEVAEEPVVEPVAEPEVEKESEPKAEEAEEEEEEEAEVEEAGYTFVEGNGSIKGKSITIKR